ncbi:MAG: response regulator transcription factor [Desulfobacteraceae bacterium]|jgi:DNA-binding NarL/FixJ family response regulator
MKVFIVDDSSLLRDRLGESIAEIKGVEAVGAANDVQMALEMIPTFRPDVVILDIHLPNGNGITVLEKLKSEPAPPIVIMFTAYPYPQYRQKCLQAGADYFFDKATEFDCIPAVLETLCAELSSSTETIAG